MNQNFSRSKKKNIDISAYHIPNNNNSLQSMI